MRHQRTFVVKILLDIDEPQPIHGQIHEPASVDPWTQSFAGCDEFWRVLVDRLAFAVRQPDDRRPTPDDGWPTTDDGQPTTDDG